VILVDVNILVYATFTRFEQHAKANKWLDECLRGTARVGLPWVTLVGFLRIATSRRILERPLSMKLAWQQIAEWLDRDAVWTPEPTEQHANIFGELVALPGISGNLVHDAHLAALAIEHGLTLCSTDGDFARFANLRWLNPLAA